MTWKEFKELVNERDKEINDDFIVLDNTGFVVRDIINKDGAVRVKT